MKRIIYFVLAILVCGIYAGCSESEIDLYSQTSRINFYGSTYIRTLVDTDYVKTEPYAIGHRWILHSTFWYAVRKRKA